MADRRAVATEAAQEDLSLARPGPNRQEETGADAAGEQGRLGMDRRQERQARVHQGVVESGLALRQYPSLPRPRIAPPSVEGLDD